MATSKLMEEETNSSSTPEHELNGKIMCYPCDADGHSFEAVGYCKDCKEFLCETCFKGHRLPSITRKHVLLDQEQMGSVVSSGNRCPAHEKRAREYHCPTHSFFGCHACFSQHQETCKDSRYIPDVAESFPSSEEFKEFSTTLDFVATKITGLIAKAERNLESVDKRTAENITAIKAFKQQVIEAVERLETDLISKAENLKKSETSNWRDILNKCTTIQEESTAVSTEIEVLQNKHQNADLFITMIKYRGTLISLDDQMNAVDKDSDIKLIRYEGNAELLEALKSPWSLGKLADLGSICAEHVTDINVKTRDDDNNCCIRGAVVMPEGKLLITDCRNRKVKLVDTMKNTVVSEMMLSNTIWSVAKVTDTTVAVTVPGDKKIVFVRTDPVLSVDRELGVNQYCYGVAYCEGKLVVTVRTNEKKVKVMDLQGAVLREIATDDDGKALFSDPLTVATDPNSNIMYVSNIGTINSESYVKCITLDGTVVATYTDSELTNPRQAVVVSNGMVFVGGCNSHNVHLITSDCKKVKVVLTTTDGLFLPQTLSYDEKKHTLYVGVGDNLKVYRVKYSPAL